MSPQPQPFSRLRALLTSYDQPAARPRDQQGRAVHPPGVTIAGSRTWQGLDGDGHPYVITCQGHHLPPGDVLCRDCRHQLAGILTDMPALLIDLQLAATRQVKFANRQVGGGRQGEAPMPANLTASHVLGQLLTDLHTCTGWVQARTATRIAAELADELPRLARIPDFPAAAHRISVTAARAHRVIDARPDVAYYGACPECGTDLWLERIHLAPENHGSEPIACPEPDCGYRNQIGKHISVQISERAEDVWLTVGELLAALHRDHHRITRGQIDGWIRREGLPADERAIPRWNRETAQLETRTVKVYSLARARELAANTGRTAWGDRP